MYFSNRKKALTIAPKVYWRKKSAAIGYLQKFNLVRVFMQHDDKFLLYFRLDKQQFDSLLIKVGPLIAKMDIAFWHPYYSCQTIGYLSKVSWLWLITKIAHSCQHTAHLVIIYLLFTGTLPLETPTPLLPPASMWESTVVKIVHSVAQVSLDCLVEDHTCL